MSVMAAAMVLAWICVVLLAFGLAGVLRQVRDLQVELAQIGGQGQRPLRGRQVAEYAGAKTVVLVIDPACSLCIAVVGTFAEQATSTPGLRFETLSYRTSDDWPDSAHVHRRVDERLYQRLDVPWTPALLVTDLEGVITSVRPVESPEDLRHQVATLAAEVAQHDTTESLAEV